MKTEDTTIPDEEIIQGSSRRARIIAFINSHPGKWLDRREIAEGIGSVTSAAEIGSLTGKLADNGQIAMRRDGLRKFYSALTEGPHPPPADEPPAKRKYVRQTQPAPTRVEIGMVELVVAGVVVAIGRNPTSGRIRIEIEA